MTKRNYSVLEMTAGTVGREASRRAAGNGWYSRMMKRNSASFIGTSEILIYSNRNA